jgi:hypothetical protein
MTGLTRAAGRIARRWQVRVTRILRQLLGELGDLLGQRYHRRHQRRDLLLEHNNLGVLRRDDDFELRDPLLRVQHST